MSRRHDPLRWGLAAVPLGLLVVLTGCATVEPWDRGALLKPHMATDPHPMRSAWRAHVENSRQAAPSSRASEGGACGCY
jgi:hypothetical protein